MSGMERNSGGLSASTFVKDCVVAVIVMLLVYHVWGEAGLVMLVARFSIFVVRLQLIVIAIASHASPDDHY